MIVNLMFGRIYSHELPGLNYRMASIAPTTGGCLCCLELKSIGLPQDRTTELSKALCKLVHDEFGVRPDRVYIEFADAPRTMWGWNGGTF